MDYGELCIIFYFCFFHISMYGFHVWLVISGIHKSEGNLDHMLNGTMKSLTNPGCFMKLLNHPGRSVFKKKVSEALSPTIQVVIQSHMLHVWNVYQHLGKYTILGAYGNNVQYSSKWKLTFDEMFLSATVINYAFGIFHGPDIFFMWVTFLAEFLTPKPKCAEPLLLFLLIFLLLLNDWSDWSHRHDHIIWEKHPAVGNSIWNGQTPCVAGFPKKYMLGGRSQLHPEKKYSSPRLDDVQEATAIKKRTVQGPFQISDRCLVGNEGMIHNH